MTDFTPEPFASLVQFLEPCEVYSLWPTKPPAGKLSPTLTERSPNIEQFNDRIVCGVRNPECMVYAAAKPNGIGVIIFPGGGYQRIAMDNEGCEVAKKLNSMGYTVFVTTYRMPGEGHEFGAETSLADAQRAVRWVRHHAEKWQLTKIGVMGFSAGGHLAGQLATRYTQVIAPSRDEIDNQESRPDFSALMYPVITMAQDQTHQGSFEQLMGQTITDQQLLTYSVERNVHSQMSPCFLMHACDDMAVDVDNSLLMWQALKQQQIPVEMHLFEQGGHGFGIRKVEDLPASQWPELFHQWIMMHLG
ncbi:alpha/beta hydrolase [Vibrio alginolyticus]